MKFPRSLWKRLLLLLAVLFVLIQFVPYGRAHDNPPVTKGPAWDSPRTAALARRFCFDCHSNETTWPWYSHVAPMSWLVYYDVVEGREHLNFSTMDRGGRNAEEAAEEIEEGEMPPWQYTIGRRDRQMSVEERAQLVAGMRSTFGGEGGSKSRDHKDEADDDD
jgi:mono/diheme cytochrome c family protein